MKKIFAMAAIAAAIAMPASAQMYVGAGVGSASSENANGTVNSYNGVAVPGGPLLLLVYRRLLLYRAPY